MALALEEPAAVAAAAGRQVIRRIETIPVRIPFRSTYKISSGSPRPGVEAVLVRLHTSEGLTGIGETQAWRRQGSSETVASLLAALNQHFAPRLIGRSPFDIADILAGLEEEIWHSNYAQAAIADALLDLQGKILGVPVHDLLGGRCRDRVAAGAVLGIKPRIEETLAEADDFHRQGYRSYTVKIGNDPVADVRAVQAIRERFPDIILRVDANAGMDFDGALSVLKKIEPLDIDVAEQMLAPWDIDGMAELARLTTVPMMADESVSSQQDLVRIIRARAASVFQTKIAKNGGIWNCRKLWTIGAAAGLRIFPGNHPGASIATMATAHLAAAWAGPLLEGPFAVGVAGLIAEDVVTEPVTMDGHCVRVPDRPGLGLELDEARIRHLRLDR